MILVLPIYYSHHSVVNPYLLIHHFTRTFYTNYDYTFMFVCLIVHIYYIYWHNTVVFSASYSYSKDLLNWSAWQTIVCFLCFVLILELSPLTSTQHTIITSRWCVPGWKNFFLFMCLRCAFNSRLTGSLFTVDFTQRKGKYII